MSVLVIADHNNKECLPSTLNTITAAKRFNTSIKVLVAGFECEAVSRAVSKIDGVEEVLLADNPIYQYPLAERFADLVVNLLENISVVICAASSFGKSVMPRIAALKNVAQLSEIIEIIDDKKYKRLIYAGNAICEVESLDDLQVLTIRTTAFEPAKIGSCEAKIRLIEFVSEKNSSEYMRLEAHARGDRPELTVASIVISGGRGCQTKKTFEELTKIADKMHAAIGASRAAVDAGLAPNDWQVGQTGQIVAPKLYFAVGISGAIQHLAGMKDSKIIVAINKDSDAPIFQVADYGIVDDLNKVLPEWSAALEEL